MAEPITLESFLECVRKSKLLDPSQLQTYLEHLRSSEARDPAPTELARRMEKDGLLTSFQIRFLLQGHSRGLILANKYKVLDLLGAGGVGRVYLAEHMVLRRLVAIKILPPASLETPGVIERFHREARAVASFNDPNILQVFDVDRSGKLHFMVMEYVEGKTLQEIVSQKGPMDVLHACHYIRQAALGLQHAHEHGWVHRDIKPSNLLVDRRKMLKILDLGLARFFHDTQDNLTLEHNEKIVLGTADYIAPEQVVATHDVDARADIYSLGASFYCLLSGRPPFQEGTIQQKLIWHQMREPISLHQIRPDVPARLAALIETMMAKQPENRFQTAAEVFDALDPFCQTPLPVDAHSSIRTTRQIPRVPRVASPTQSGPPSPTTSGLLPSSSSAATTLRTDSSGPGEADSTPAFSLSPTTRSSTEVPVVGVNRPIPSRARAWMRSRWGRMVVLGLLGIVVFLLSTGGMLLIGSYFKGKVEPSVNVVKELTTSTGRNTLVVCSDPALAHDLGSHHRRSLREALQGALPGDVIRVVGDPTNGVEDHLLLEPDEVPRNLTLEGYHATGKPGLVAWKTGRMALDSPLLTIRGLSGVTVRNFRFQGEDRIETLVQISGECPGMKLEESQLEGAKGAALVLQNATGLREEVITLRRLRLLAPVSLKPRAAVLVRAGAEGRSQDISFSECRFEGPAEAALRLEGPAEELYISQSRFFKVDAGLVFRSVETRDGFGIALTNNTFYDVSSALSFERIPAEEGDKKTRLRLKNNLFIKTPVLVGPRELMGTGLEPARVKKWFPILSGNVRDPQSGEKGVFLTEVMQKYCEGIVVDPDHPGFLHYPANSPLWKAGVAGAPVGSFTSPEG